MNAQQYVIGLDFGTDSVRAVLIDTQNGETKSSHVFYYPRWKKGLYCDPAVNRFRQHPRDHIEGMEVTIKAIIQEAGIDPAGVRGICIDTTGSSPVPVDQHGTALAMLPEFSENPNAMMVLWKDHTAIKEAEEINTLARTWGGIDYTQFEGGVYSSEWFWAKILHVIREDDMIQKAAYSWIEHCDLMTYILVQSDNLNEFKRSRCAAGHKAMWHESWGGLPEDDFLSRLDPHLVELKKRLYADSFTSDESAGTLNDEWANRLGLSNEVVVSVGTFDAHAGAVGAEVEEFSLVRVMGTSTCDIIVSGKETVGDQTVAGICGQVDGSVIPGMVGLEAGQSAFGDLLAWFIDVMVWPIRRMPEFAEADQDAIRDQLMIELSNEASKISPETRVPIALDWINGRRTPDANQALKAAISGLNLGTDAPLLFRALVEAICYGSRKIVERFQEEGVAIKSVVGIGGVAKKSSFVMQTLADVLQMPIKVAVSEQAPALGAAMYASVAADIHPTLQAAIKAMGNGFEKTYQPDPKQAEVYNSRYQEYCALADFVETRPLNHE